MEVVTPPLNFGFQVGDFSSVKVRCSAQLNRGLGSFNSSTLYNPDYLWNLPIEGKLAYVAILSQPVATTSLFQVGDVPSDAKSLRYKAQGGPWEVRVNGISLDLHGWDSENKELVFQEVAVDISPWAGQQVELRLSQTLDYDYCAIDSIRLSVEPIPEPRSSTIWLLGGGSLFLMIWLRRRAKAQDPRPRP